MTCVQWLLRAALAATLTSATAAPAAAPASPSTPTHPATSSATLPRPAPLLVPPGRPRIGLVLSGGGARGIAHVGVLKVLERERVPIDVIAGTSMGAIVGGLYASGMRADEIETELRRLDWGRVFAQRPARQELSQRRKEEDFELSTVLEFGIRAGELRAPQSTLSSRGLEALLRRFTLPVHGAAHFDDLPIPFRAVATDMETGSPVVMSAGDLALALRSSMSVPGVFSPIEVDGRVLGDGGLVNNLPIDVAREMGADIVIAVNIGTPLAGRETLGSLVGVTAQMINILTEQNVQRSLAAMGSQDVLVTPDLGTLAAADFDRTPELLERGEIGALAQTPRLTALALPPPAYAQWREARVRPAPPRPVLARIDFEGTDFTNPARLQAPLESRAGQPFDPAAAERDTRRLAATGDYLRTDYTLRSGPEGDGLVFELEDKPWGPNYVRVGIEASTDFAGRGAFNLRLTHNRHWLTPSGTEWRNRARIGSSPSIYTELYHPLNWTIGLSNDWFVAGYAGAERVTQSVFAADAGPEVAQYRRTTGRFGLDLGQPWGGFGELRVGLTHQAWRLSPQLLGVGFDGPTRPVRAHETGLRLRAVIDQLDYANFPQSGYRAEVEGMLGERGGGALSGALSDRFRRFETQGTLAWTAGRHTLNLFAMFNGADTQGVTRVGRYGLGGFHMLSGYQPGQLAGNAVALGRLTWYRRLSDNALFSRGFFLGATLEAGEAWSSLGAVRLHELRTGGSVFLGADTGLGPMYLGLTYAPEGQTGLALFIGRP